MAATDHTRLRTSGSTARQKSTDDRRNIAGATRGTGVFLGMKAALLLCRESGGPQRDAGKISPPAQSFYQSRYAASAKNRITPRDFPEHDETGVGRGTRPGLQSLDVRTACDRLEAAIGLTCAARPARRHLSEAASGHSGVGRAP